MTDSEKLDLLLAEMQGMKTDMRDMKADMQNMKADIQNMKADIQNMKADMQNMRTDIQNMKADILIMKTDIQDMKSKIQEMDSDLQLLKKKVTDLEFHTKNVTDRNIQLIAENFIDVIRKLNEAIPAADNNRMYEVKVNYLIEEVNQIKEKVEKLMLKTAG